MPAVAVLIAFAAGASAAGLLAGILCRWLVRRNGETARIQIEFSRERSQDLERRLSAAEGAVAERDARLAGAQQEITRHKTELASFAARLEEQGRAHGALRDAFQSLSLEALKSNGESFLQLARGEFERLQQASQGDLAKRQDPFDAMLDPIREGLEKYDEKLLDIERERTASYAKLETQLIHVSTASETLRAKTASLAGALKSSTVRGTWVRSSSSDAASSLGWSIAATSERRSR